MRFKLDENLGQREIAILRCLGHDVVGVHDQGLGGAPDDRVHEVCARETRTLITLDRGFGNVLRFPPDKSHGIVVLELPERPTPDSASHRLHEFLAVLSAHPWGASSGSSRPAACESTSGETPEA